MPPPPSLEFPHKILTTPPPPISLLFLSRNEAIKLLCPLWIIFRVGVMALCPAALHLPCFPSSFIHACTVSCLAANLLTWRANVPGVSSLQLCPFYTIHRQRLCRCRVGQHFAAMTQHCLRRVCSSPQWYINWLCSCNEIMISVETTRL